MNDHQIRSVNTRNLLNKITVAIIVVAAYQLIFSDPVKPSVERFDGSLIDGTKLAKLELISGSERDGRTKITMQFSLNIDLGKQLNTVIKAVITTR
nr:hypothetical protein [uncultured Glaciecola sp.]